MFTLLAVLLGTIFIGTPVAFALGFAAVVLILFFLDPGQLIQIGSIAFYQGTSINQLVAPLFILMAEALARGEIAGDIFSVLNKWLRRIKGGLALSTMLASTIFAALCGSSPATAAAMGRISISEMEKRQYRQDFAVGVVAAGGTLGIMIPPSITLVIFGIITENSITRLFMAGIIPGIVISGLLCLFIVIRVKLAPSLIGELTTTPGTGGVACMHSHLFEPGTEAGRTKHASVSIVDGCHRGQFENNRSGGPGRPDRSRKTERERASLLADLAVLMPPALLIFIVLGSLYAGIATPTEAAGFGAVGALLIVILRGRLTLAGFTDMMSATARTSSMILFLIIGGMTLSYVVSHLGIAQGISNLIVGSGLNRWMIMALIYLLWFVLGCLMDPLSMIVLTVPFIYPTLLDLGFDPLWLGIVSTLCVEIGMITPPVGLNLFILKAITDVPMGRIMMGTLPFVLILLFGLLILSLFPQLSLYLPSKL